MPRVIVAERLVFRIMPFEQALQQLERARRNGFTHVGFSVTRYEEPKPKVKAKKAEPAREYARPGKIRLTDGQPGRVREFQLTIDDEEPAEARD